MTVVVEIDSHAFRKFEFGYAFDSIPFGFGTGIIDGLKWAVGEGIKSDGSDAFRDGHNSEICAFFEGIFFYGIYAFRDVD